MPVDIPTAVQLPASDTSKPTILRAATPPRPRSPNLLALALSFFAAKSGSNRVDDPSRAPWSGVCKVVADGAATSEGAGFLIDPQWVLTAAHVIANAHGARTLTAQMPGGQPIDAKCRTHDQFGTGDLRFDFALLKLAAPVAGYAFQLYAYADTALGEFETGKVPVHVCGFPEGEGGMVDSHGLIESHQERLILHRIPTADGLSGGPLLHRWNSGMAVMGVHSYVDPSGLKGAARFTDDILTWIGA